MYERNAKRGISLWSINRLLRVFGWVLTIGVNTSWTETRIWVERKEEYDARIGA